MLCRRALPFALLPFLLLSPVEGVFKLLKENSADIVSNPKQDVLYLFMFPRTSTTPSQAAYNLMVETWLHWKKIPFHRINNQVYLGSMSKGTAPFAFFNGQYIDGSVQIVEAVGNYQKSEDEAELMSTVLDMFNILMVDRAEGLDWMVKDEGLAEVIMSQQNGVQVQFAGQNITTSAEFWKQYFDAFNANADEEKVAFVRKYFPKVEANLDNWNQFDKMLRDNQIHETMKTLKGAEPKLKTFLTLTKLEGKDKKQKNISEYSLDEVSAELKRRLDGMAKLVQANDAKSLHSEGQTLPDAALFGVLVQYFETPLNLGQFQALFPPQRDTNSPLLRFTKNIKNSLDLPDEKWEALRKRPWQLNFDTEYIFDFANSTKYNGPYLLEAGDLLNIEQCVKFDGQNVTLEDKCADEKFPPEVLESAKALLQIAMKSEAEKRHCHARALIGTMSAYLCSVGTSGASSNDCEKTHLDNAEKAFKEMEMESDAIRAQKEQTRRTAFDTVIAYNDAKTGEKVLEAIAAVKRELAKARGEPKKQAEMVNPIWLTNEF